MSPTVCGGSRALGKGKKWTYLPRTCFKEEIRLNLDPAALPFLGRRQGECGAVVPQQQLRPPAARGLEKVVTLKQHPLHPPGEPQREPPGCPAVQVLWGQGADRWMVTGHCGGRGEEGTGRGPRP